jgi:RNA polymerase sigma-70 factor (ECF subfamily)
MSSTASHPAFADFYSRHRDEIRAVVRKRSGSEDLADDLTSEVFVRALQGLDSFHGGNFAAWLTRIATNVVADHYRSATTRREVAFEELDIVAEPLPGADLVVVRRSEEHRRMQALESAWHSCRRLNDDQRACLSLRFLEGMSVAQTAERMGRSEGAVKLLQHRAIRLLRQDLQHAWTIEGKVIMGTQTETGNLTPRRLQS